MDATKKLMEMRRQREKNKEKELPKKDVFESKEDKMEFNHGTDYEHPVFLILSI